MSLTISVIIPTYNSAKTLATCLQSLSEQTFRDFEVLIIDGVSKDDTVVIANSFSDSIPHLTIFSEPDKGIYDAMNKGIGLSKGEWLYFLGSDDELHSNDVFHEVFVQNAESINCNHFVYGNVNSISLGNGYDGAFDFLKIFSKNICHQSIFYKRFVFIEIGSYDLKYPVWADWDFNIKCFENKKIQIKWLDVLISNYADGGFSNNVEDKNFYIDMCLKLEKHIPILAKGKGITNYELAKKNEIVNLYRRDIQRPFRSFFKYLKYYISGSEPEILK